MKKHIEKTVYLEIICASKDYWKMTMKHEMKRKRKLRMSSSKNSILNLLRFKEHLESTLSQLTNENKSIFIMGDFNINLLNCESHPESNDFLLMLNSFFLLPYILEPTRITERSATLIDNIFANTYAMNAISGNLVSKISDHLPQFLIVDNLKVNYKVLNYYKNDFSKFDEEKFINDFSLLDWNNISSDYMDANTKFDIFYDQISQFINSHVHVESFPNVKLSYLLSPGLLNLFLPKFDIEVSSIPKSLGVNIQIQT